MSAGAKQPVYRLRKSRRQETKWFGLRGSPANEKLNGFSLATVLQTRNQTVRALQQCCRQETKQFWDLATLGTAFAIEKEVI